MSETVHVFLACAAAVTTAMLVLWLFSLRFRNATIAAVYWGPGFAVVALVAFVVADGYASAEVLRVAAHEQGSLRLTSLSRLGQHW